MITHQEVGVPNIGGWWYFFWLGDYPLICRVQEVDIEIGKRMTFDMCFKLFKNCLPTEKMLVGKEIGVGVNFVYAC